MEAGLGTNRYSLESLEDDDRREADRNFYLHIFTLENVSI